MLTEREKQGVQDILGTLAPENVKSLASTISKGQVVCNSDAECVKVILAFEKSGEEFLHRRVVTKKVVTQYAHEHNLQNISECQFKGDFVKLILKHWSEPGKHTEYQPVCSPEHKEPPHPEALATGTSNHFNVNILVQSNSYTHVENVQTSNPTKEDYEFGKTFCNWFFNMLNKPDPVSHGFGPSHFMPQAEFLLSFSSPESQTTDRRTNNIDIANHFIDLSKAFKFNPNLSQEGMRVKSSPHGLKLVLICGVLYQATSFCGAFQQSFGLVKDPNAADTWKIQVTALKCFKLDSHFVPQLDDTALELENVTIDSLQKSLKI